MSVGLRTFVRRLGATHLGSRIGRAAYLRIARIEAERLARLPGVRAVYATGSLLGAGTLAPGQSDIDLVLIAEAPLASDEVLLIGALERELRMLSRLGGLFHNVDLVLEPELPLIRAFGNAWAIELDREAICLAGSPAWSRPAERPEAELARERFCRATRRWMNASGLLLDPRRRLPVEAATRLAGRLVTDVGFAWLGESRHQSLAVLEARLRERGVPSPVRSPDVLENVAFALELLDSFASDMASQMGGTWPDGDGEPAPPERARFEGFARSVLGGPLAACLPVRRAPALDDWVPLVVAGEAAAPLAAVRALHSALIREQIRLEELPWNYRRPVLVTPLLLRAAALFDPAPFTGAASRGQSFVGLRAPLAEAPGPDALLALVRARAVEAFTGLRSIGLRGRRDAARRRREEERRYGLLLPALRRALRTGALSEGQPKPGVLPASDLEAASVRRAFFAETSEMLVTSARLRLE